MDDVAAKIVGVEAEIADVREGLKTALGEDKTFLREKELLLMKKEGQIREELLIMRKSPLAPGGWVGGWVKGDGWPDTASFGCHFKLASSFSGCLTLATQAKLLSMSIR